MQAAPIGKQQNYRDYRHRVSRRRIVEDSGHAFERRQRRVAPNLGESRPEPLRQRRNLLQTEISRALNRGERSELKHEIGKSESREYQPDALEASQTAQPIAQCELHWIEEHQERVARGQSEERI